MATIILDCEKYMIGTCEETKKQQKKFKIEYNIQVLTRDMKKRPVRSRVFGRILWREKID